MIPKERYDKLVARMVQKTAGEAKTRSVERRESVTSQTQTTTPESSTATASWPADNSTDARNGGKRGPGDHDYAKKDKESELDAKSTTTSSAATAAAADTVSPKHVARMSKPPTDFPVRQGERTLEEIQANHTDFLPPGEPFNELKKPKPTHKMQNKTKPLKRKGKPFSALSKKWVKV